LTLPDASSVLPLPLRPASAEERLRFLSEAGELLASSLDVEGVLRQLARLAVPALADWCTVDLLEEGGRVRRVAVAHVDPAKVALAEELGQRYPVVLGAPSGVGRVLVTRQPEVVAELSEPLLERAVPDPERRRLVKALGLRSYQCLPLLAHGRALGALSLVYAESGRGYGEDEVRFAQELARRAAAAVDRARLFREAQEAARRAERERALAETLSSLGLAFASERDTGRLLQRVTDEATRLTGASFGAYFHNVPDAEGRYGLYTLSGAPLEAFSRFPNLRPTPLFAPTFRGEGTVRLDDVTQSPRFGRNPPHNGLPRGHLPVRSYLAVTVRGRDGVLGGLFFGHAEPGRFSAEHERVVEGLAAQAAVALDNARLLQEAQEAVRVRDEFLSIATHELKTPLTSLKLQHHLIARHVPPEAREAVGERLATAVRQVDRLGGLVDALLDVSRITTGRLHVERAPMDLAAAVREAAERLRATFAEAGCALTLELPDALCGEWDALRVDQVLVNLLTNASKYGRGRPVHVRAWSEAGQALVSVRDEGFGISAEDQARIFGRFERAVSERHYGGLGLGLYISRQVVERLGGRISVQSVEGQGATFTVSLPL
jgi:signal transduction histidine kinase